MVHLFCPTVQRHAGAGQKPRARWRAASEQDYNTGHAG